MPVVSNTSPILNLAIIGQLDLLRNQFGEVVIPRAVLAELRPETQLPGSAAIQQALQEGWLRSGELETTGLFEILSLELDDGEAATIALALQLGASQVLMDEHDGRKKAKTLRLEPTGVLGVLLKAKGEGRVGSVKAQMARLRQDAGFFIADDLFETVLAEAGER